MNSSSDDSKQNMQIESSYAMDEGMEIERLSLQQKYFEPLSRNFFENAGIKEGMKVLELGCGVGGVTGILADQVGKSGCITTVDSSKRRLAHAQNELRNCKTDIEWKFGDLNAGLPDGTFDVIAGRMILMHLQNPGTVISEIAKRLNPGGIFAFQEPIHDSYLKTVPESEIFGYWQDKLLQTTAALTSVTGSLGRQLPDLAKAAGLEVTSRSEEFRVSGGTATDVYKMLGGTIASLAPKMVSLGVIKSLVEVSDIENELRKEAVENELAVFSSKLVGVVANP